LKVSEIDSAPLREILRRLKALFAKAQSRIERAQSKLAHFPPFGNVSGGDPVGDKMRPTQ
jgi:hypothetical protein